MKSGDASQGIEPGSSHNSRTEITSLPAELVEHGVIANFKLFILFVCSVMVKNSLFIHKHYTPDKPNQRAIISPQYEATFHGPWICSLVQHTPRPSRDPNHPDRLWSPPRPRGHVREVFNTTGTDRVLTAPSQPPFDSHHAAVRYFQHQRSGVSEWLITASMYKFAFRT